MDVIHVRGQEQVPQARGGLPPLGDLRACGAHGKPLLVEHYVSETGV